MTREQQYWSLNGSFEALTRMINVIDEGKITSVNDMREMILMNMAKVSERMVEIEDESSELKH